MPLRKQHPVRFYPKGLSDAYDSTETFAGACRSLSNLVFDNTNPELVGCRPGVISLTTFSGFTSPTFVTVFISIDGTIYGMVSTARNPGKDEPFAYNIASNTFTTISGVTNANTPTSPSTSGAWTPPSMTVVGKKIIVTHTGFSGAVGVFFGVLDITNPASPAWSSANTATNLLPTVPTWVANLNNRAYFACANVAYYSDVLNPTTITNASQSLTLGDPSNIVCMSGLPVQTTSAGVVQALLVFKEFQIWQVTGDAASTSSPLALNYLSLNVGTSAHRSVVQTPFGTNFMAIDGPYIVNPLGTVQPLTKEPGATDQDVQAPFIYATQPSRVAAGYSGGIYRICVDTFLASAAITADYWFDLSKRRWNGPHTFPSDCLAQVGNYFVLSHRTKGAVLYKSQLVQDSTSVFTDAGTPITFALQSSTLPKDATMTEKQVVESTIELSSSGAAVNYAITAINGNNTILSAVNVSVTGGGSVWGAFFWGAGLWSSNVNIPNVYTIPWTKTLVFQKLALQVSGTAQNNIAIGSFFARYQDTGYTNMGS